MTHQSDPSCRRTFKTAFAKTLRLNATDAERRLWSLLRGKRFAALRFRRQQPLGPYVADFFCPSARLILELDGGQHTTMESLAYDAGRTRFLEARGYRVLRFPNRDVLRDPHTVLDAIWHALNPPSP